MKRNTKLVGICVIATGAVILLTCFLPPSVMVCFEAALLIAVGLCCFFL